MEPPLKPMDGLLLTALLLEQQLLRVPIPGTLVMLPESLRDQKVLMFPPQEVQRGATILLPPQHPLFIGM